MNIRTFLSIRWPFSTKTRLAELSRTDIRKLERSARLQCTFRSGWMPEPDEQEMAEFGYPTQRGRMEEHRG